MIKNILHFLAPVSKTDPPHWFFKTGRFVLSLFIFATPFLYDTVVPEVAGDPRWMLLHTTTGFLLCCFMFYLWKNPKITLSFPLAVWLIIGITITAALSLIDTINIDRSLWFFSHFISYCALFGLIYILRHKVWYRTLLWLIVLPVSFNGFVGVLQFFDLITWFPQSAPPAGTFANKNLAASWLVITLPIAAYLMITAQKLSRKLVATACFTLGLVFLVYTRSRASWVSFFAAILFLCIWFFVNKKYYLPPLKPYITPFNKKILAVALIITIGMSFLQSPLHSYSINLSVGKQFTTLVDGNQFLARKSYNVNGLAIVADHPFNGTGIGTFRTIYPKYHQTLRPTPKVGYNVEARPQRAHNDLMQTFIEQGILAGFFHISLIFTILFMTFSLCKTATKQPDIILVTLFLTTSIIGISINALGDFPLQMPTAPIMLFSAIAMVTGYYRLQTPHTTEFKKTYVLPKTIILGLILLMAATTFYVTAHDFKRREGNKHLQIAMWYSMKKYTKDPTLNAINTAYKIDPNNPRTQEYRAVIYNSYTGKKPISTLTKIAIFEETLKKDPYAANHMINLAGLYFNQAFEEKKLGSTRAIQFYAPQVKNLFKRLLVVADFSEHTWTIGGLSDILENNLKNAELRFKKSLQINPHYIPAHSGLTIIHTLRTSAK